MQRYTVYLSLENAVRVSGGISTHHQEHIQLYLQHLALVKPLLLTAAILEELELCTNPGPVGAAAPWKKKVLYVPLICSAQP
jgi:hypothetical protein